MSYHPTIGRFLETDPETYVDGMNLYQYVGSNPVGRVDPLGLAAQRTMTPGARPSPPALRDDPTLPAPNYQGVDWDHWTFTSLDISVCGDDAAAKLDKALWKEISTFGLFNQGNAGKISVAVQGNGAGFSILGPEGEGSKILNDQPFMVRLHRDPEHMVMIAETLGDHPVQGLRQWQIIDVDRGDELHDIMVYTEGYETARGPWNKIAQGILGGEQAQKDTWDGWFLALKKAHDADEGVMQIRMFPTAAQPRINLPKREWGDQNPLWKRMSQMPD